MQISVLRKTMVVIMIVKFIWQYASRNKLPVQRIHIQLTASKSRDHGVFANTSSSINILLCPGASLSATVRGTRTRGFWEMSKHIYRN